MAKKKKKTPTPLMLLWSKRDQLRFVDAVERFCGLVNDLTALLAEPKRRAEAAAATRAARKAAEEQRDKILADPEAQALLDELGRRRDAELDAAGLDLPNADGDYPDLGVPARVDGDGPPANPSTLIV